MGADLDDMTIKLYVGEENCAGTKNGSVLGSLQWSQVSWHCSRFKNLYQLPPEMSLWDCFREQTVLKKHIFSVCYLLWLSVQMSDVHKFSSSLFNAKSELKGFSIIAPIFWSCTSPFMATVYSKLPVISTGTFIGKSNNYNANLPASFGTLGLYEIHYVYVPCT